VSSPPFITDSGDDGHWQQQVVCPICRDKNQHVIPQAFDTDGDDNGKAWDGRGDLYRIPFWGECGHNWHLCLGFHKGETFIYAEKIDVTQAPAPLKAFLNQLWEEGES